MLSKLRKYLDFKWLEDNGYSYIQVYKYRLALMCNPKDFFSFGFELSIECVDYDGQDWAPIETLVYLISYYGPEFPVIHIEPFRKGLINIHRQAKA